MESFTTNVWNILPIAVAILIGVITFYQNKSSNKNQKGLSYEILAKSELINEQLKENNVEFTYNNNKLDNLSLVIFEVINTGKVGIEQNDFEKPMRFFFGEESKILNLELTDKNPDYLDLHYKVNQNELIVEPILLNSMDSFKIKLLITSESIVETKAEIRIKDIKINEIVEPVEYNWHMAIGFILIVIGGLIFAFFEHEKFGDENSFSDFEFKYYALLALGLAVYLYSSLKSAVLSAHYIFVLNRVRPNNKKSK